LEALEVAPSTYYSKKSRPPSKRSVADAVLLPLLVAIWVANYSVYGRRKLTEAARRAGHTAGRDQIARLIRQANIHGARRHKKHFTTHADPSAPRAPDLLHRDFTANAPNVKWVCDFTYCATWSGVVYVAFVVDCFSRRIVGWKAARSMSKALVIDALNMAAWVRRHVDLTGLTCHSDAGSQPGFNRSSQHVDHGGVCGEQREGAKSDVGDARQAPIAGSSDDYPARAGAGLLEADRERCHHRGSGGLRRRVIRGRGQVVQGSWRDVPDQPRSHVRPVPLSRRA
jgi:transposase InsO family protein